MATKKKKKNYVRRIPLDVPPSAYEAIKAHTDSRGESVNGFLKRVAREDMERSAVLAKAAQEVDEEWVEINISPEIYRAAKSIDGVTRIVIEESMNEQAELDRDSPPVLPADMPVEFEYGGTRYICRSYYNTAEKAAAATGETVAQFMHRAIYAYVERINERSKAE